MLTDIKIGQYFPGNSILHRLDPRVKLISLLVLLICIFVLDTRFDYIVWTILVLVLMIISKIPMRMFYDSIKPILWIIGITFILHIFSGAGEPILKIWGFGITWDGISRGIFISLRLFLLMFGSALLTFTTPPLMLADAMEDLMEPLKKVGVPTHEIAMMMTIALRFIPTLLEETDKIIKAQKSRGADFTTGSILNRIKAVMPILIPLFIGAFRRADELALAMEARCYHGGVGRTRLKKLALGKIDYVAAIIFLVIILVLVVVKFIPQLAF